MAAWRRVSGRRGERTHRKYRHRLSVLTESGPAARKASGTIRQTSGPRRGLFLKTFSERKRPVRGDNRTGQAIWALGVDGRSRRIQPMGRDYRSHIDKSQQVLWTFKTSGDFFNFFALRFQRGFRQISAEKPRKITVSRRDWRRLRRICPTPSQARNRSAPCSRKRYCDQAFFPPPAARKPRRRAPQARQSRP